jgi:hypothetical protein
MPLLAIRQEHRDDAGDKGSGLAHGEKRGHNGEARSHRHDSSLTRRRTARRIFEWVHPACAGSLVRGDDQTIAHCMSFRRVFPFRLGSDTVKRSAMELNNWKDWLPLAGVAIGWGLNQCGQWLVFRRDERKAIGRALADLLEVRHRLLGLPKAVEAMTSRLNMPAGVQAPLKVILGALFPPDEGLAKRYEESVNLVAGTNPILAFRLRSQDLVGPFLHRLRAMAMQDGPQTMALFGTLENHLFRQLSPHLERLIRELARRHGWRTQWETSRRLKEPFEVPEEFWEGLKATIPQSQPPTGAANAS